MKSSIENSNVDRHAAGVRAALARQGYNLTQAASDWTATQKRLATLNSQQQVRLQQAVQFSNDSLDLLQQKYDDWVQQAGSSGFKKINQGTLAAMKQLPGPAGSAAHVLEAQIADRTSELGTVYKGGNASTDESLKLAAKNLDSSWNQETFKNALKTIRQNLQIRRNSINNSITPVGVGATLRMPRAAARAVTVPIRIHRPVRQSRPEEHRDAIRRRAQSAGIRRLLVMS